MCGIVGMTAEFAVADDLVAALTRMEYRGYDSAGLAVSAEPILVRKVMGPASGLRGMLPRDCDSRAGIAHTRWATHGRPDVRNAHPHVHGGVAVVHNGIIENHHEIRLELMADGCEFTSSTDTEVIPHLVARALERGLDPIDALAAACTRLEGAYALAVMHDDDPETILVARSGAPLVLGRGAARWAVASDASSLEGFCDEYMPLADGTVGSIAHSGVEMRSVSGVPLPILWRPLEHQEHDESMHGFNHHTRKEIAEQPCAIRRTDAGLRDVALPPAVLGARRLLIIGCGSSLYAAATAKPFIERMTGVPCDIEIASEFRYRCAPLVERTVGILVSQSGETADTISSLELLSEAGIPTVAVVNVPESSLLRGADIVWPTCAGQEIGVAATKTFTSQIVALLRLGLAIAAGRGLDGSQACIEVERAISAAAETCAAAEILEPVIEDIALRISEEREALFIGRGWGFAVAGEAALKLKELSYLRADAYAAGELKHGPIALVHDGSPVIVHAPSDALLCKTISNAEEVLARGAHVIMFTDRKAAEQVSRSAHDIVVLPGEGAAAIFSHVVALQLLAYHVSICLGRDPDRPRNLAKSVTVE